MDNLETLLEELERFEKKGGNGTSKILEEYIQHVAKTGDPLFPWHRIRYFMRFMLATVMNDFYENCGGEDVGECGNVPAFSYVPTREKILHHFDTFSGAPFTIQRLCEIMIDPTRHYKRTDKFLRGLEKNVLVVSTIEPGRQRRSEDPQQTLVNGLQDGGLHSSPISGSSRLSSPSHQSKRIASPQPTNSVNNANDFYDAELNASDSHVSGSEANGPNGIPLDERSIEAMAEIVEPLMKKRRMKVSPLEKLWGPMAHLAHLQDKDSTYMSISEAESLEAEGSDEESNASSSSSSSAKTDEEAMETGEAEATTCHTESEDTKTTEETLCGHQVGTSEMTLQEAENPDEDSISKELKDEMPVPAEACSSDVMNATESEKSNDESNSVSLSSDSSGSGTNQGSPDSVEDNSEQAQPHPQKKEGCKGEKAGSSEAAAADLDTANEADDDVSEGASAQEEPGKDSHEADSTSQTQSNNFSSQSSASGVGSSTSVTSCSSPSTASTSAASVTSPVASPPSDSGDPTTSQISASASSQLTDTTSTETNEDSAEPNSAPSEDASTTSSLPESDSAAGATTNNDATESTDMELGCWCDTK
ncbi:LOW QUALITY PROTEIN: serine/threonine-protein phosphatase 4 regulatory subunit 2-like [Macrobrachium nipponense]|uniref:LOW QUALITY PROTEIN: serine/threonine-protein phosphatase 4 regulatory subunit 2-like n=1 Tax=Macrobrachium nipponense TaxID=159736 RepID=UPI0030C7FBBC